VRRRGSVLVASLVAALAAACGSSSSGGNAADNGATPTTGTTAGATANANGCTPPPSLNTSSQSFATEPPLTIARATYVAQIVTNCGTITVSLDGKAAPHTVNSFAFLAGKHFFDDSGCARLTTARAGIEVLQCGESTGGGVGSPGYMFTDENLQHATYPPGTLAMANAGPNTNGSQFFFVYGPSPYFKQSPNYTPFGHVTAGLDVLKRIAAAGDTPSVDGQPNQPVVIESFTVTKG
jgi:peptidyl-prolyl cis-trans isomerase B (cyclophilin B)